MLLPLLAFVFGTLLITAAAMLFMPRFECPSGVVRLRLEYAANVKGGAFTIRFKADDPRPAWDVAKPPAGGDGWP